MIGRVFCCLLLCRGALLINEFMPRPEASEGEWVELYNAGDGAVPLRGLVFGDGSGRAYSLEVSGEVGSGEYLILAQRPDSLVTRFTVPEGVRVLRPSGWPILNDRDGKYGYADILVLRDAFGNTIDSLAYRESWLPPRGGRSVERGEPDLPSREPGSWGWSLHSDGGTPGSRNSLSQSYEPMQAGIVFRGPRSVHPLEDPAQFVYALPRPGRLSFWLLDFSGRHRQELKSPALSPAQGQFLWSGTPAPQFFGPCFVCLYWSDGVELIRQCRPVWVQ